MPYLGGARRQQQGRIRLPDEEEEQQRVGQIGQRGGARTVPTTTATVQQQMPQQPTKDPSRATGMRPGTPKGSGQGSAGMGATKVDPPPSSSIDQFLDPQTASWLRGLLEPTDTAAQEAMAREQSEAALGRSKANLEARGGMAGMGLAGGQIAMAGDMERQSATDLADQILGIQDQAAQRDLQRGTVAAEFLDRAVGRSLEAKEIGKDDAFTMAILAEMGLKPVVDEDGNVTSFERVEPEVPDAQAEVEDENRKKEQQYGNVPPVDDFLGMTFMPGAEEVDSYQDSDGTWWLVLRDQDGNLHRLRRS